MPAWPPQEWCLSFVLALGHFLWQGTLIAVGLAIALRATKKVPVRYWLSLAALLVMAACPIVTLGWLIQPMSPVATRAPLIVREEPGSIQSATSVAPTGDVDDVGHDSNVPVIPPVEPLDFNTTASIPEKPPIDERSWWQKFAPQLTTAYLCGVALMLLRLVFGLWGGRRLRRRVHLIDDPSLLAAMRRQATALGLKLLPVLAYCERVTVPTVETVESPPADRAAVGRIGHPVAAAQPASLIARDRHSAGRIDRDDSVRRWARVSRPRRLSSATTSSDFA